MWWEVREMWSVNCLPDRAMTKVHVKLKAKSKTISQYFKENAPRLYHAHPKAASDPSGTSTRSPPCQPRPLARRSTHPRRDSPPPRKQGQRGMGQEPKARRNSSRSSWPFPSSHDIRVTPPSRDLSTFEAIHHMLQIEAVDWVDPFCPTSDPLKEFLLAFASGRRGFWKEKRK